MEEGHVGAVGADEGVAAGRDLDRLVAEQEEQQGDRVAAEVPHDALRMAQQVGDVAARGRDVEDLSESLELDQLAELPERRVEQAGILDQEAPVELLGQL